MKQRIHLGRTLLRITPVGLLLCGTLAGFLASSSPVASTGALESKYIGASKCKNCHSSEEAGDQFAVWQKGAHSRAFDVLSSEEAKKVAAERGIADPTKSDECLQCHVAGHGLDEKLFKKSFKVEEGVSCEACHGPGDDHARARMRAAMSGDDADAAKVSEGEIHTGLDPALCMKCHNEKSPTFKPFHFCERVKTIRHYNPAKPRTAEEKAALEAACQCPAKCGCDTGNACEVCGATGK